MMTSNNKLWFCYLCMLTFVVSAVGCAEGMFWKTGYLSPWVRQQWSAEEEIAATLFTKRPEMERIVEEARNGSASQQEEASQYLADIVASEPVLLLRIEATRLLGQLNSETAARALQLAAKDREVAVRRAAVKSLGQIADDSAAALVAQMALGDSDMDVRIAATSALGKLNGPVVQKTLSQIISNPDPAMQLKAAESLASTSGQNFGYDIQAWQQWLGQNPSTQQRMAEAPEPTSSEAEGSRN